MKNIYIIKDETEGLIYIPFYTDFQSEGIATFKQFLTNVYQASGSKTHDYTLAIIGTFDPDSLIDDCITLIEPDIVSCFSLGAFDEKDTDTIYLTFKDRLLCEV